jgi:ankyrin repeat protein
MSNPSNELWELLQTSVKFQNNEEAILKCIEDHPDQCSLRIDDKYPINLAVQKPLSHSTIDKLLRCFPDCCMAISAKGSLLLHEVLTYQWYCMSPETIKYVIDIYPAATQMKGAQGELPLHIECKKQCRPDFITKLLNIYPDAIRTADKDKKLPLHSVLSKKAATFTTIILLLGLYPDATRAKDKASNLPLHIECKNQCRQEVITKLIGYFPEAISMPDKSNNLPLHDAVFNATNSSNVISYLINLYPDATRMKNTGNNENLPLHIECRYKARYEVIVKLVDVFPGSLSVANKKGCYALHYVSGNPYGSLYALQYVYGKHPTIVSTPDVFGQLPLFHAVFSTEESEVENLAPYHVPRSLTHADKQMFAMTLERPRKLVFLLKKYPPALLLPSDNPVIDMEEIISDRSLYRTMLHISCAHLSTPKHIDEYHELNWQSRSRLLYALLHLSGHENVITLSSGRNQAQLQLLLRMTREAVQCQSVNYNVEDTSAAIERVRLTAGGWDCNLFKGDDLVKSLLRGVVSFS